MRLIVLTGLLCVCALSIKCGSPVNNSGSAGGSQNQGAALAVPDDIAAVARGALGREGEALAWGNLALNGNQEVLVVNRLGSAAGAGTDEIIFIRMTIAENIDGNWTQVLLCDDHLKNSSGVLAGSPNDAVSRWKLSFKKDPEKGLILSLTPMDPDSGALSKTIHVRWNPLLKRYQSFEGSPEHFANEVFPHEIIQRPLR